MLRYPCGADVLELDPATWILRRTRASGEVAWQRSLDVGAMQDPPVDPAGVRALGLWRHRLSYRVLAQACDAHGNALPPREAQVGEAGAITWREGADPAVLGANRHVWLYPDLAHATVWAETTHRYELSEFGVQRPDLVALDFVADYVDDDIPGGPDLSGFSYQRSMDKDDPELTGPYRELVRWNGWLVRVADRMPGYALLVMARKTAAERGWECGEDGDALHTGYHWVDQRELAWHIGRAQGR